MPNLLLDAEALNGAAWINDQITVTANNDVAPNGTTTADTLISIATFSGESQVVSGLTPNTQYTLSFYVKNVNASITPSWGAFDVTNSANIVFAENYLSLINTSSYTRVIKTFTTPAGCTSVEVSPYKEAGQVGATVRMWGVWLNVGATADPYPGLEGLPIPGRFARQAARKFRRVPSLFDRNPVTLFDRSLPYVDAGGPPAITGTATQSQAQTSAASGTFTPPAITGTSNQAQAQTSASTGAALPPAITGVSASSQAQTTAASGTVLPPGVSGTATQAQAQTSAAIGNFTPLAITGTATGSQAQTSAATGSFAPAGISGDAASTQAQTSALVGSFTPQAITGAATQSQAQTSLLAGTYTPAPITGGATGSQAQTTVSVGAFSASGISGDASSSQAQTSLGVGAVSGGGSDAGGGSAVGGFLHKYKLTEAFKSEQARQAALKALPKAKEKERQILKKAAISLVKTEPANYKEIEDRVSGELKAGGFEPSPHHLDWLLYYLKTGAYALAAQRDRLEKQAQVEAMAIIETARLQAIADEEEAIVTLLLGIE